MSYSILKFSLYKFSGNSSQPDPNQNFEGLPSLTCEDFGSDIGMKFMGLSEPDQNRPEPTLLPGTLSCFSRRQASQGSFESGRVADNCIRKAYSRSWSCRLYSVFSNFKRNQWGSAGITFASIYFSSRYFSSLCRIQQSESACRSRPETRSATGLPDPLRSRSSPSEASGDRRRPSDVSPASSAPRWVTPADPNPIPSTATWAITPSALRWKFLVLLHLCLQF